MSEVVSEGRTWGDLMEFVKEHKLDQEEYFNLSRETKPDETLWLPDVRWISVYWVEGGSEGYYLHVDRMAEQTFAGFKSTIMAVGKFWTKPGAERACNLLTRFVYGLRLEDGPFYSEASAVVHQYG